MSDSGAYVWGVPGQIANANLAQTQNNSAQLELLQKQRGLSALHGIDIGNPDSVQKGINALAGLGLADQAKSLTDLAQTRFQNTTINPILTEGANQGLRALQQQDQSSDQQQPDLDAAHKQILQDGADAVGSVMEQTDPVLRSAAAATARHQLEAKYPTIPKENFDEIFGDLSDAGLQQHRDYLEDVANGREAEHPTGHAASRSVFDANNPGGDQARQTLQSGLMNPVVQGIFEKAGIPLSSGINQAIAVTNPARSAAASAPYTPVTVEGRQGQPVSMSAANFAAGQGQAGAQGIEGATPYVKSAQIAAAGAPYLPVTTNTGPGGAPETQSAAQFASGRGAPAGPDGAPGPANAPPLTGPSPAAAAAYSAGGAELAADRDAAKNSQPQSVALRKVYDLLPTTNTGPGTTATNGWRSFLHSQAPLLDRLIPGFDERTIDTARTDELRKYMVQIAGNAASQYGQGTNEKLAVAASGNPNPDISNLAARDVTRMNIALLRAKNAMPAAFDATHQDPSAYGSYAANYATTVDPRAFMLDLLSKQDRAKLASTITTVADKIKWAKGVQAAIAAGDFTMADVPR